MSLGVAPGSSNGALHLPYTGRGGGGGGKGPTLLPLRGREWGWAGRGSASASSFRTPAAVGEGGSAAAKGRSFYELLGITEEGSFDEVKRAYKRMALKYHPDVSPPDRTEEYTRRFIEVQEAYETLSDPRSRELYDRHLAAGLHLAFSAAYDLACDTGCSDADCRPAADHRRGPTPSKKGGKKKKGAHSEPPFASSASS